MDKWTMIFDSPTLGAALVSLVVVGHSDRSLDLEFGFLFFVCGNWHEILLLLIIPNGIRKSKENEGER